MDEDEIIDLEQEDGIIDDFIDNYFFDRDNRQDHVDEFNNKMNNLRNEHK